MSKHTEGPWTWVEPSNWHGLDARVFIPEPYGVVAQVPIEAWRPRSIGRANARLIAAAPEMLDALKLALGDLECNHDSCPVCAPIRAAIAKAEDSQLAKEAQKAKREP